MKNIRLFCSIVLLIISSHAWAQVQQPKAPIPFDPAVKSGILANGMRYYLRQNAKPEQRAELRLVVQAGSMQEDADQLGLAHFVEHMAFNGTRHFPKSALVDYLESIGTRFGPDLNAYTSFDETVYMIQARTDSMALLEKGLLILEDWASAITFDAEEIDKERGVVISEWRNRLSPDQRMQQQYFPTLYQGSRYAERLPIGDPLIIEKAPYETVKRFYQDWYRPELMAVIAVGDFDLAWMEREVKARFGRIAATKNKPREREHYRVPGHQETLFAICSDKEAAFTTAQVFYKHPRQEVRNIADYKALLARNLYNRMLNARLFELQQQPNPPFTFASTGYGADLGDIDSYSAYAFTAEGQAISGLRAVLLEVRRAQLHGFTETELARQKTELLKAAESAFRERDKTQSGTLAMRLVSWYLRETPMPDAEQYLQLCQSLLPQITLADINPLPRWWITKDNRVLVVTGPDKANSPLPTEAELQTLLDEIDSSTPPPYVDQVSDAPLLSERLVPAKIIEEKSYKSLNIIELKLENGVRVVLKPTDFKNDEILLSAFSPGGHSLYSDADYQSAANAAQLIDQSGIGSFNAVELQKKLTGKRLNISPSITELYEGFNGSCSPDDLETLLQMIYLYCTSPRLDDAALQSFIARQQSIFKNMMANPYFFFNDERNKLKYNNHPRRLMTKSEDLDRIVLQDVLRIYRERFADASDFTFVIVGTFDTATIRPLLATYLGNLPAAGRQETWRDVQANLVPGRLEKTIVRGEAPKSLVELTFHGNFDYADAQQRYEFASLLDLLRIKLRESMREDKGGVYGVSVFGSPSQYPKPSYFITISFNCDPNMTDELIQTALTDIEAIKTKGADEKDLQKIRETQKQTRIKSLKENSFWSGQLLSRYQNGIALDELETALYDAKVDQLNSIALQKAANRYFNADNFMRLVLLPEVKE